MLVPLRIYQVGIVILWLICLRQARNKSWVLFFNLVSVIVYTSLADFYEIRQNQYVYSPYVFALGRSALIINGLAWSTIFYAVIQNTDKLGLPLPIRPLVDALTALTIGLSMEPIASICTGCPQPGAAFSGLGFWDWEVPGLWFHVPLEAFSGWFMLITVFTYILRLGQRRISASQRDFRKELQVAVLTIVIAFPIVLVLAISYQWLIKVIPEPPVVAVMLGIPLLIVLPSIRRSRRDNDFDPVVAGVPAFYHLYFLGGLLLTGIYRFEPGLIGLWLMMAFLSFLSFSWPYWDRLFAHHPVGVQPK